MTSVDSAYFVVLLGPDGSGKTSLMRRLRSLAPAWKYTSLQPDDLYPIEHLGCYDWALRTHPREYVQHMEPMTRASFFMHIISLEWEFHIRPALSEDRVVVCDSFWYRTAIKEVIQNPTAAMILKPLTDLLPKPDLIMWLDLPLEEAWRRNGTPTVFEVADGELTWKGFATFQQSVLDRLREETKGIPHLTLDGMMSAEDLAHAAHDYIRCSATGRNGASAAVAARSGR